MRLRFLTALAICVLPTFAPAAAPDDIPLAPAVECTARTGLPNFYAKLEAGRAVRIAYLGGSITAQEGWRPKTLACFQKSFPAAKLSQINAAIGGTGSDLGVFRLKQDVLDHKPDLLFVEFAVNDSGAPPRQIYNCMEGIVRQTWKALPDCDLCFVYTLVAGMAPTLQEGKFPRAASAMEKVAANYGIPSIHMGLEVARLAREGKLIFQGPLPKTDDAKRAAGDKIVFSPDNVHPYAETGHELYLQAIVRSLPSIRAAGTTPGPHTLPAPLVASNYERAQLIPIDKAHLSAGFKLLDPASDGLARGYAERLRTIHRANKAGETITFKFKGTRAAVYDVIGPDCGQVSVTLDGQPAVVHPRFDAYCLYHRLATLMIGTDLPDTVHTVKIEIHKDQPDKAKILAQLKAKMDDPKRFNDSAFYPGALLLVGELVD
ncbi:MAG: SGNH/GDSL hydrolase family protein [Thermoguttaceae bacterium]|jgi:lysophospholipase L1-like esterase